MKRTQGRSSFPWNKRLALRPPRRTGVLWHGGLNTVTEGKPLSCFPRPGLGVLPLATSQVKVLCDSLGALRDVLPKDQRALPSELRVWGKDPGTIGSNG